MVKGILIRQGSLTDHEVDEQVDRLRIPRSEAEYGHERRSSSTVTTMTNGSIRKEVTMKVPVVGINIYSVPKGKAEEFIRWWSDMRERLISGTGFVAGRLHRNLDDDALFNFINVAEWEDELYSAHYKRSAAQMKVEVRELGAEMTPGLFAVVSDY